VYPRARPIASPSSRKDGRPPPHRPKLATQRGGSAEHAGDGGHFQLRVVAQCRDEDILLYYAKSGQSSWVGILVGTDALSLVSHGTGGEEVQLADPLRRLINNV
jgi:hypothetical protein